MLFWWTFSALVDGMDRDACLISPGSRCCYLFHFLWLVQQIDKLMFSSPTVASPLPLSVRHVIWKRTDAERKGKGSLSSYSERGSYTQNKSESTKINNQTNKQPNKPFAPTSKMNCYLELTLFLCSFCDSWCNNIFLMHFVILFVSLNYSSSEPHKHGSVAPGSPPEGRKKALQCTKKSKLNQKCCSWCLFYTVVLLAFFVTVIIWWRFPNCTKLHGN